MHSEKNPVVGKDRTPSTVVDRKPTEQSVRKASVCQHYHATMIVSGPVSLESFNGEQPLFQASIDKVSAGSDHISQIVM